MPDGNQNYIRIKITDEELKSDLDTGKKTLIGRINEIDMKYSKMLYEYYYIYIVINLYLWIIYQLFQLCYLVREVFHF